MRFGILLTLFIAATAAWAAPPAIRLRNTEGTAVLNDALQNPSFWSSAKRWTYQDRMYDTIQLKPVESGYVPMITGESDQDIPAEAVAEIVFHQQNRLPRTMSGAVAVINLGTGVDAVTGASYQDTWFLLDLTAFYAWFYQRMYRYDRDGQTVLAFEKLTPSMVDAATWTRYDAAAKAAYAKAPKGSIWRIFGDQEVTELYGMFRVEPGSTRTSRVTFVSRIGFGSDSSWLAQAGSKMPSVIRGGLENGFDGCVSLAKAERDRRAALPPPAPPPPPPVPEATPAPPAQ